MSVESVVVAVARVVPARFVTIVVVVTSPVIPSVVVGTEVTVPAIGSAGGGVGTVGTLPTVFVGAGGGRGGGGDRRDDADRVRGVRGGQGGGAPRPAGRVDGRVNRVGPLRVGHPEHGQGEGDGRPGQAPDLDPVRPAGQEHLTGAQ